MTLKSHNSVAFWWVSRNVLDSKFSLFCLRQLPFDIFYHIMSYMDLSSVLLLSYTCSLLCQAVMDELRHCYLLILHFLLHDVQFFRHILRITNSVIAGPITLALIDRRRTLRDAISNTVHIYSPQNTFDQLHSHFLEVEKGVIVDDGPSLLRSGTNSIAYNVLGLLDVVRIQTSKATFHILRATSASPTQPLPYLWSTLLMNFFTADAFCIAYPKLTLKRIGIISDHIKAPSFKLDHLQKKYETLGYRIVPYIPVHYSFPPVSCCRFTPYCPAAEWYFGDQQCLTVIFDPIFNCKHAAPLGRDSAWVIGGPSFRLMDSICHADFNLNIQVMIC